MSTAVIMLAKKMAREKRIPFEVSVDPFYSDALYNRSDTYGILKNTKGQAECENKIKEIGE